MNELIYMTSIGVTATVFIVAMKLLFTKFTVPGFSEIFAFV